MTEFELTCLYKEIDKLEESFDKSKLYSIGIEIINMMFVNKKLINPKEIYWDIQIVPHIEKYNLPYDQYQGDNLQIHNEILKRNQINCIKQGFGTKAQEYLYHFTETNNIIPNELLNHYWVFMRNALETHNTTSIETLQTKPAVGSNTITWQGNLPIITCRATNFIILLHEMIKGFLELLAMHGYPKDKNMGETVNTYTSSWVNESIGLKSGGYVVKRIMNIIEDVELSLLQQGLIRKPTSNIITLILAHWYTEPAEIFVKQYSSLMQSSQLEYFKKLYLIYTCN